MFHLTVVTTGILTGLCGIRISWRSPWEVSYRLDLRQLLLLWCDVDPVICCEGEGAAIQDSSSDRTESGKRRCCQPSLRVGMSIMGGLRRRDLFFPLLTRRLLATSYQRNWLHNSCDWNNYYLFFLFLTCIMYITISRLNSLKSQYVELPTEISVLRSPEPNKCMYVYIMYVKL